MLKIIFQLIALGNAYLAFTSFQKIRHSKRKIEFIYSWAFLYGAFVWEDLLLFSLYFFCAALVVLTTGELKFGALLFLVFWIIRSAGETLYFFLQQFIQPKHAPHKIDGHFLILQRLFGLISSQKSFIIMQVFFQTILITCASLLILLVLNWHSITWKI